MSSEWISVEDRLPGDMQTVVVAEFNGEPADSNYSTAWMDSSAGLITNDSGSWTHWMPLPPDPPENKP